MTLYDFLLFGAKLFSTLFVLGLASMVLGPIDDDDDDNQDGGILQPAYVTNRWASPSTQV